MHRQSVSDASPQQKAELQKHRSFVIPPALGNATGGNWAVMEGGMSDGAWPEPETGA